MSSNEGRPSATIHPFPAGGRADRRAAAPASEARPATIARLHPPVAVIEFGGGWYHQQAIEDERGRPH